MTKTKSIVPEGSSGDWRVERFTVTAADVEMFNMRCMVQPGQGSRFMTAGTYTRLMRGRDVIMSDTRAELNDHWDFVNKARGQVLINGLGLGVCLQMVLAKECVDHVTIIERSEDVIKLVWPSFVDDPRVTLIQADALEWKPAKDDRYDAVWHDIWDNICGDNLPDMHKLHRKYGRRTDWQGSWCRELCQ